MQSSAETAARILDLELQKLRLQAPLDFSRFLLYINPKYRLAWFHKLIADKCQALFEGRIKNLMVFIPPQSGKALRIDTPVLTANRGFTAHGDLRPDDTVFAPDGRPVRVQGVTPHYEWECARVSFADAPDIIASVNHEWPVSFPSGGGKALLCPRIETRQIPALKEYGLPYIPAVPTLRPDESPDRGGCDWHIGTSPLRGEYKHFITAISPCGRHTVNCIQVNGGYYLAGPKLIPTHNSEIISRSFPAWALGRDPDLKIAGCSYSADLASQFSRSVQRIMDSPEYADIFPDTYLNGSNLRTTAKGYLRNVDIFETVNHRGFYKAVGVGGGLTGTPVDIAIIDDPVKDAAQAYSQTYRNGVWDWYNTVLTTRLHNASHQLFIMTRWHEDDLAGRILKSEPSNWEVLSLPAICTEDGDGGLSRRKIGDPLWPSHHSLEQLLAQKARSPREFSALYQQNPTVDGGNIVRREWFQHISQADFSALHYRQPVHFYLDTAYSKRSRTSDNDPSGILAATRIGNYIYLLHAAQVWKEMPDLLRFLPQYMQAHGATEESVLHIEPKANGISVVQMLRETSTLNVRETPTPVDDKEVRIRVASPRIECGRVFLVEGSWTEEFLNEVCAFPAAAHDEFVDILGYAIADLIGDDDDADDDYLSKDMFL